MRARVGLSTCLLVSAGCSVALDWGSLVGGPVDDDGGGPIVDGAPSEAGSDTGSGCAKDCQGGPCVGGVCQPFDMFTAQGEPTGISVDGAEVFWVNRQPAALYRAPKSGGNRARIDEVADAIQGPWDVAVDDAFVYWSELTTNTFWRKPRASGAKQRLGSGAGRAAYLVVSAGQIFATDYRTDDPGYGTVISTPAAGGNSFVAYPSQALAAGIGATKDTLVWARGGEVGALQAGPQIVASDAASVPSQGIASLGVKLHGVAVDGDDIYVLADERRVLHLTRTEPTPEVLYEAPAPFGESDIAVDDKAIYWTERLLGNVKKLAR